MSEQDQTPRPDDDTTGHGFHHGRAVKDSTNDDDTKGHARPPLDTGDDDTTSHAVRGAEDAADDATEGHGYYHGG